MAKITIKNFRGMNLQKGQWSNNFAKYVKEIDLYGLNDNPNKISFPGVLQGAVATKVMSEAGGVSSVTEAIQDFEYYNTDLKFYAIGRANPARIYRLENNGGVDTWTWVSAGSSAITTSGNGNNLKEYAGNLYYASHSHLGKYDGTTGNANFKSFTNTLTSPRPMKVMGGSLYIGAGNFVSKYDGTTWIENKLILPSDMVVRSIEVFEDRLIISADDLKINKIFIWDGISPTFEDFLTVADESRAISIVASNGILWGVSNRGSSPMNQVYVFNGSVFNAEFLLPIQRSDTFAPPAGLTSYKNGILIGGEDTSTANYEDGTGGCWYVGKDAIRDEFYATLMFTRAGTATNKVIHGIFTAGNISPNSVDIPLLFSVNAGSGVFEIDALDTTNYYTATAGVWQSLPIDADDNTQNKIWKSIILNFNENDISSIDSITIKYKLNNDASFTTLKTLTLSGEVGKIIPIRRKGRTIEIRLEVNSSSSRGTTVDSFTLEYELTKI